MSSFTVITQQVSIYYGIPVLVAGVVGGILNTIVFLSLKTFRESSCAFYLTIMSIVNIAQLLTGLLTRIMISGYGVDWTATSPFYCKFRYFLLYTCTLISLTCICLATIDQYFATCSRVRWRQWCNLKIAYRVTAIIIIFWSLHGILYLVFYDTIYSPVSGKSACTIIDPTFIKYQFFGYALILAGILPISITIFFALMAFRNVRQLSYQTVPLVRRELEKQLTMMVLVQVAVNSFTLLPSNIVSAIQTNTAFMSDPNVAARIQFASIMALLIYYLNFTVSINQSDIEVYILNIFRHHFISTFVYLIDFVDN